MADEVKAPAEKRLKVAGENEKKDLAGPNVLNVATFPGGYPRLVSSSSSCSQLAEAMYTDLRALYAKFLSADGWHVDYDGLRHSQEMATMVRTMEELQTLDLAQLSIPARTALCLNLYNLLCIHTVLHQLPPGSTSNEVPNFFTDNFYVIGGFKYCLDDIEHGLVRGDRAGRKCEGPGNHFPEGDPRKVFSLPLDLRAHAAMVCAGKGCPVICLYSTANVDKELTEAMSNFVMRDTTVDLANKTVLTSKIFEWYDKDFGADKEERLRCLQTYARGEVKEQLTSLLSGDVSQVSLNFLPYQWQLNGTLTSKI